MWYNKAVRNFGGDSRFPAKKECFSMTEYKPFKEGNVREIYDVGDALVMVAPTASPPLT